MRWPESPYPMLSADQRAYVLGALLGDDALLRNTPNANAHLRAQQSLAHRDYLMWKYQILRDHTLTPPRVFDHARYERVHTGVRFNTRATPDLTAIYRLCYPGGKKAVSIEWLEQLTVLSLATWYMDDGTYNQSRHTCTLYTGAFPRSQQCLLQDYLRIRWEIAGCVLQENRQQWCLRFTRSGTQQWLQIVAPVVWTIPSMRYKLGHPEYRWRRPVLHIHNGYVNAWRPPDDQLLKACYGRVPVERLCQSLGRTVNAVYLRAKKLGLRCAQQQVHEALGSYHAN